MRGCPHSFISIDPSACPGDVVDFAALSDHLLRLILRDTICDLHPLRFLIQPTRSCVYKYIYIYIYKLIYSYTYS